LRSAPPVTDSRRAKDTTQAIPKRLFAIEQKRPERSEIVQDLCGKFLTIFTHAHE